MEKMDKKNWGFDTRDIDESVRPQDDFYHYVNGGWLKKITIPPHESRWGSFYVLRYDTEKKLREIVARLKDKKNLKYGTPEQMVRDLYRSGLDVQKRNALGLTPLQRWLDRITQIKDVTSLVSTVAQLEKIGGGGPWSLTIDQDMKNSEKYILYLYQGGLGMPDRDYYLKNDAESNRVRSAYEKHLTRLLRLAGRRDKASQDVAVVLEIETALAKASMPKEELRDVDKTYYKKSLAELSELSPSVPWREYFKILGAEPKKVIVAQPDFFKEIERLFSTFPLSAWQTYLSTHLINDFASCLTSGFEKENFSFYGTTLTGTKHMKPLWRRALGTVNGSLGELLGKLYVKEYFTPKAKRKIASIVDDLFTAYEARIKNLDWMSTATKKKAVQKLRQMNRKLGYPDKWRSYHGLVIRPDEYVENIMRLHSFEHHRYVRRLTKSVDRKEWFMSPQTVNAYYSLGLNDIVFPAAILQPPFFRVDGDDAINYGAMGSVIGHEITHGFDDQGSKFDGKGNRKTWWMKDDRVRFEKKTQMLVEEFSGYTVAGGLKVNGQLTLGENIADLGGVSIAFDAYMLRLAKIGRTDIKGFSPEQRFFLGFALFEREKRRPEAEKTQVLTDPHSPGKYRINGPASNLPEFYAVFGVKKGDALYREQKNRAKIW
ncbi:M13 family metallopeptidase [Candidatus Parcubacteria bacterium]|nr:M13 family metallopeptidase [Candidatus Parcubacteria bacterium]